MSESELNDLINCLKKDPRNELLHIRALKFIIKLQVGSSQIIKHFDENFSFLLECLLKENIIISHRVNFQAIKQLKFKFTENGVEPSNLDFLEKDPLLILILKKSINNDLEFEIFLTKLRYSLLLEFQKNPAEKEGIVRLTAGMAQQCFNNEYIFQENSEEEKAINELECLLPENLSGGYALLVYGMYKTIYNLPFSNSLLSLIPSDSFKEEYNDAMVRLLHEPLIEKSLKKTIISFGNITCNTSLEVRAQYEENPYPRWISMQTEKRKSIDEGIKKKVPDFSWPKTFYKEKLKFLVAGSGTGQTSIITAYSNPEAEITAIDLSLSSLAYGKRMAEKYGIFNIKFLHGDILDLPGLGSKYHHIGCGGVIHHMKDQYKAWKMLDSILLPGGTMYLGVYSKLARIHISLIRQKILQMGLGQTRQEMKTFRKLLLNDEKYKPLLKILVSDDFFSMSMFRDYLFHKSEYQYTLSKIEELIKDFGLQFVFFHLSAPMAKKYKELFPEDANMTNFNSWKDFEKYYTGSFELFNFLVQKPF